MLCLFRGNEIGEKGREEDERGVIKSYLLRWRRGRRNEKYHIYPSACSPLYLRSDDNGCLMVVRPWFNNGWWVGQSYSTTIKVAMVRQRFVVVLWSNSTIVWWLNLVVGDAPLIIDIKNNDSTKASHG